MDPPQPTTRSLLGALLLAGLAGCDGRSGGAGQGSGKEPRNLVLIVLDTLRPDHLGAYGYDRATSPNLDALADRGVVFETAQSVAPWTAPALISLVTGLYPDVHQVRDFPRPARMVDGITTLTEVLRDAGLRTAAFTEGGFAKGDFGLDQGFDLFWKNEGDDQMDNAHMVFGSRLVENVGHSLDWLRDAHEEPFFLFFHTYEPHAPYHPEPEHLQAILPEYDAQAERVELRAALDRWEAGAELTPDEWLVIARHGYHCELEEAGRAVRGAKLWEDLAANGFSRRSPERIPELAPFLRALYDAEIRCADEHIGRLFATLEELGHRDDTLIVVVSDHGEAFGEHGLLGHGLDMHTEVLSIVMLMSGPGLEDLPARIPEMVRLVDVMPTVIDLFGLPLDELPIQGRTLLPLMRGREDALVAFSHPTVHRRGGDQMVSVRTTGWRYVATLDGENQWLYDLEGDPGETADVKDEHPEVLERMREMLGRQRRMDDELRQWIGGELEWPEMGSELRDELRALGYLESDDD